MIDKNSLFEKLISKLEEKVQFPEQWELITVGSGSYASYKTKIRNIKIILREDNLLVVHGDGVSENFGNDKRRIQDVYLELDKNYKEWLPQKYGREREEELKKLWDALDK